MRIDHIVLRARNVPVLVAFYHDVLGCPLVKVQEKFSLWQMRAGDGLIDIVDVDGEIGRKGGAAPGKEARNLDHVCLRIEPWDEDALMAHLRGHGIEPEKAARRYGADGYGLSIYIEDPEGNTVELKGPSEVAE
ncbi:MAG: VOC family protein [Alphaproteobacteria bacterium]|nr:VOC family protein [Alphaproteobacteria bacterium]